VDAGAVSTGDNLVPHLKQKLILMAVRYKHSRLRVIQSASFYPEPFYPTLFSSNILRSANANDATPIQVLAQ
jgi:hypothetical protein